MSTCCTDNSCPKCLLVEQSVRRGLDPRRIFDIEYLKGEYPRIRVRNPEHFYLILTLEWHRPRGWTGRKVAEVSTPNYEVGETVSDTKMRVRSRVEKKLAEVADQPTKMPYQEGPTQ